MSRRMDVKGDGHLGGCIHPLNFTQGMDTLLMNRIVLVNISLYLEPLINYGGILDINFDNIVLGAQVCAFVCSDATL